MVVDTDGFWASVAAVARWENFSGRYRAKLSYLAGVILRTLAVTWVSRITVST